MINKNILLLSVILIFSILLTSCTTSIEAIRKNPSAFDNKIVFIEAKVLKIYKIPFTTIGALLVGDNTDILLVLTKSTDKYIKNKYYKLKIKIFYFGDNDFKKFSAKLIKSVEKLVKSTGIKNEKSVEKLSYLILKFLHSTIIIPENLVYAAILID